MKRSEIKFYLSDDVHDVITHVHFGQDRLRGRGAVKGQILGFPTLTWSVILNTLSHSYTILALCVIRNLVHGKRWWDMNRSVEENCKLAWIARPAAMDWAHALHALTSMRGSISLPLFVGRYTVISLSAFYWKGKFAAFPIRFGGHLVMTDFH